MDTEKILQSINRRLVDTIEELKMLPVTNLNVFNVLADLECVSKKMKRIEEIYKSL